MKQITVSLFALLLSITANARELTKPELNLLEQNVGILLTDGLLFSKVDINEQDKLISYFHRAGESEGASGFRRVEFDKTGKYMVYSFGGKTEDVTPRQAERQLKMFEDADSKIAKSALNQRFTVKTFSNKIDGTKHNVILVLEKKSDVAENFDVISVEFNYDGKDLSSNFTGLVSGASVVSYRPTLSKEFDNALNGLPVKREPIQQLWEVKRGFETDLSELEQVLKD